MSSGSGGASGQRRPSHIISPDEVPAWLADSVVKTLTYHRTTAAAAREIVEHGVQISRSRIGSYSQGFYTATVADPFYGDTELTVAIRALRPLVGDQATIAAHIDEIGDRLGSNRITPAIAGSMRRELRRLGYDAVVVSDAGGDGIDYVIALRGDIVKVVLP